MCITASLRIAAVIAFLGAATLAVSLAAARGGHLLGCAL